ncbi:hypothetical protein [Spirillospora albida]|uniref:hypothetical protein n=1 Tax=Spirillospora albida TaxID=58123 RepID=UPI000689B075|nr:hypothetical protein [Spirillospora albida]
MESSAVHRFLTIYLNDHLAGAAIGVDRIASTARAHRNSALGGPLRRLATDIAADRGALLSIMVSLGVPVRRYKSVAGWAAEKAGRLKPNGRITGRSPLTDLVELEALRIGVEGKAACWRTLLTFADEASGLRPSELRLLEERARSQITVLEELRLSAADRLFHAGAAPRSAPSTPAPAGRGHTV